ncbi:MAG TPA: glycosyltransferase family 2 protein [Bryobacteraceae bacterium]|nr:glycosyltransferase family 2 protein [Bryobacteraceae bacterium]
MPDPTVTVVVPTLSADSALAECLESLARQSYRDFQVIVVDNSGNSKVTEREGVKVIRNEKNVGFGAAINQGIRACDSPLVATLNDDTVAQPEWLQGLVKEITARYEVGMAASQIRMASDGRLDSAGMLLCADGSSKQRGHLESPERFSRRQEVLMPSGCAAIYKRDMLDETGLFDEDFFLYCEDTDLGLRARWGAWECTYVPGAVVEHRYSHSAGRASDLKAFYVERNRLFVAFKNFPRSLLLALPFWSLVRYFWHFVYGMRGQGAAAEFKKNGGSSLSVVMRAHMELFRNWSSLRRKRKEIRRRLTPKQFRSMVRQFYISPRRVASL